MSVITDTMNYYHTFRGFSRDEIILLETLFVRVAADKITCQILIFPPKEVLNLNSMRLYFILLYLLFSYYFQNMHLKIS